jgi:hypothetical protein
LRANKKIADAKRLDLQIQELRRTIDSLDDNDPKNWDYMATLSKSLVEKEKQLRAVAADEGE